MGSRRYGLALVLTALATPATAQDGRPGPLTRPELVWPSSRQAAVMPDWRQIRPGPQGLDTSAPVVPGATEILQDAPNVFSWSRFQSGRIGAYDYRLFPDGSAIVTAAGGRPYAQYVLTCRRGDACEVANDAGVILIVPAIGAPRPPLPPDDVDGLGVAEFLARWILAGTGTPPPEPAPPTPPQTEDAAGNAPGVDEAVETDVEPGPEEAGPDAGAGVANNLLAAEPECAEPDPFYPDACAPSLPPRAAPRPVPEQGPGPGLPDPGSPASPSSQPAAAEPQRPQTLAERYKLACSLSAGATLQYADHIDYETAYGKLRTSLGCNARLGERISLSVALVYFPIAGQQAPWDPDFTYALNMRVTDKLSLSYSSYAARFAGGDADLVSSLLEGSLRASYKLPALPLPKGREANCTISIGLSNPGSDSGSLSCGTSVTDKLRVGLTLYAYPANTQEPWNPDYSYTVSYRVNDRMTVNYSNYSANRWPWNRGSDPGPGVLGGSLGLSYKIVF